MSPGTEEPSGVILQPKDMKVLTKSSTRDTMLSGPSEKNIINTRTELSEHLKKHPCCRSGLSYMGVKI